jgi:hypothetical protein
MASRTSFLSLYYSILLSFVSCDIIHAHSSSFFMPRSVTHGSLYELSLTNYHEYHTSACEGFSFYITPFYIQSTNQSQLARYFLPNGDSSLKLQEDGTGNIDSLWLNLIAAPGLSYSSNMKIAPQRKVAGTYFNFRFDGTNVFEDSSPYLQNLWLSVTFAVMQAHNNLHVTEQLTGNMTFGTIPGVATGLEAFNNPEWEYGKLSTRSLSKWGFDDIQIKLGDNWFFDCGNSHFGAYLVGTIPTGNEPQAHHLFEPLVGTKHAACGVGINGDWQLYKCATTTLHFMSDVKYRYLFSGPARRSFDLNVNGDWSRYLLLVNGDATSMSLFGINSMTVPVKVTPGAQVEAWFAFHAEWNKWNFEAGYNLWYRSQDQSIHYLKQFPPNTGIYDLAGIVAFDPTSASQANISESAIPPNQAPSDASFTPSDGFDKASGVQSSAFSNTIYLALSFNDSIYDRFPFMCGLGGSYEFAQSKSALSQWSLWQTIGFRF